MAYWINQAGNSNRANWRQFYCDTDADVQNLPTAVSDGIAQEKDTASRHKCSVGSVAISLETSNTFILNSNNKWIKQTQPINIGDGGASDNLSNEVVEFGLS